MLVFRRDEQTNKSLQFKGTNMKKKIVNAVILILFAAVTFLFGINASWACTHSSTQNIFSETDPNDPVPEIIPMSLQPIYSDEDPNEPEPVPE